MKKGALTVAVGRELARLRLARGLSQESVAHGIGLSQTYLSRLERGRGKLEVEVLARWTTLLGTRPSVVLTHAGEPDRA